ncbi:MAG: hypothetical protein AAGA56_18320 [Myxococcota bacterium]
MEIFNSARDLRVVIRTLNEELIDTRATELEVEDALGRFSIMAGSEPSLASLIPSVVIVRKRDGSEVQVKMSWGTLTAVDGQARIIARDAEVAFIEGMRLAV